MDSSSMCHKRTLSTSKIQSSRVDWKKPKHAHHSCSKFESLPIEILYEAASYLYDDRDLVNLTVTCKTFANSLIPVGSAIWKRRFLAHYDHPDVDETAEYATAYQLRRFVLRQFVEFRDPKDRRLLIQLDVLKDMVVETYFQPEKHLPQPLVSKNLLTFESFVQAPWMTTFLSSAFFPGLGGRYGQPHALFDALQLVLSHLLLSPAYRTAHVVKSSRENYDLVIVYNWNEPFSTLYRRRPTKESETPGVSAQRQTMFPNLKPRRCLPKLCEAECELDTHALLHIRNFWHRHLIDNQRSGLSGRGEAHTTGENTYANMARRLLAAGISPKKWDRPLTDGLHQVNTEWYGNWSCVHPCPKKRQDLEEMQTCAEDWKTVDPMMLDFSVSNDNKRDGYWSPIFNSMPAFAKTIPEPSSCHFIRGLAPFVELPSSPDTRASTTTSASTSTPPGSQATLTTPKVPKLPKYHPYLSLRLRGVIHPIPRQPAPEHDQFSPDADRTSIPGWNRIVMILYKPCTRYLVQVLEHAEETYGGEYGPTVTSQVLQSTTNNNPGLNDGTTPAVLDAHEIEVQLQACLEQKLVSNPLWLNPATMNRSVIEKMEEKFRLSEYLDWNDIDYAYAYEGVVIPGGKIMMGRWWRCGVFGEGDGLELAEDGEPVGGEGYESQDAVGEGEGEARDAHDGNGGDGDGDGDCSGIEEADASSSERGRERERKPERGPFVFWC